MAQDIQFPEVEPRYHFERDCLGFRAVADGKPVECFVSAELLLFRFGAKDRSEEALRQAFREHRIDIEEIAGNLIQNGGVDEDGRVFLTTQFTRLTVHFDGPLARDAHVILAHRMLARVIGPHAGEVIIEWRSSHDGSPNQTVLLRIKDPAINREIATSLPLKIWADPYALHVQLALAWSALLSARSRDLVLKSG